MLLYVIKSLILVLITVTIVILRSQWFILLDWEEKLCLCVCVQCVCSLFS